MAGLGMRLAERLNGGSRRHGAVSRRMCPGLWPGLDAAEVPIGSVTNGVHAPTWVAAEILDLRAGRSEQAVPADDPPPEDGPAWTRIAAAAPERIWEIRRLLRARLVAEARRRLRASWRQRGASDAALTWIDDALDENVLTIGFPRRWPSHNRPTPLLSPPPPPPPPAPPPP